VVCVVCVCVHAEDNATDITLCTSKNNTFYYKHQIYLQNNTISTIILSLQKDPPHLHLDCIERASQCRFIHPLWAHIQFLSPFFLLTPTYRLLDLQTSTF